MEDTDFRTELLKIASDIREVVQELERSEQESQTKMAGDRHTGPDFGRVSDMPNANDNPLLAFLMS